MAPKKKKGKKAPTEDANPTDAILLQQQQQHTTKQIVTAAKNYCVPIDSNTTTNNHFDNDAAAANSDDDDDSSAAPMINRHTKNAACSNINAITTTTNNNNNNNNTNSSSVEDGCLHCHTKSSQIQVRCDECGAYVCNRCHWCHEFQANHEIRVCDRCDAFYCRACDEMDQCDDCGEVVCGSCSTLLSCKFCGCGLCEECATACGRCGIVLCSRDAKFAVECDTCRLSYCLVCLASGNKDPCVRCGHRPSKRMEQLVHLRLKSIYKAFKSSTTAATSAASSPSGNVGSHAGSASGLHRNNFSDGSNRHGSHYNGTKFCSKSYNPSQHLRCSIAANNSRFRQTDDSTSNLPSVDDLTPGALMLAAAASAAAPSSQLAAAAAAAAAVASVVPNVELAAAAHAAAGLVAHGSVAAAAAAASGRCATPSPPLTMSGVSSSIPTSDPRLNARASAESYEVERIKAEKAAAALLAELEEEEQAEKLKLSKKKKKKQRLQAKRVESQKRKEDEEENINDDEDDDEEDSPCLPPPSTAVEKELPTCSTEREIDKPASSTQGENTETTTTTATTETAFTATKVEAGLDEPESSTPPMEQSETDPLEIECQVLVDQQDEEGLEKLLLSIKGVPGKAVLRKNLKKALKRIRATNEDVTREDVVGEEKFSAAMAGETHEVTSQELLSPPTCTIGDPSRSFSFQAATQNNDQPHLDTEPPQLPESAQATDLLHIVSQSHNVVSSTCRLPKGHHSAPKSECIMHMAPLIVGWVIGKGGQRIRDLMEESGARIWIDQDSMGPLEPRIVYVSGQRSNVDAAVRMITNLIAKAPAEIPNSKPVATPGVRSVFSEVSLPRLDKAPVSEPVTISASERSAFQIKPREKKRNSEGKAWREITCDPRFVPLLIGRRGWTIKNIQDSSGARVDIDQNVTPRKITISGSDAAVEIAARMVGDVLSYPHSLLHDATDDIDIFPAGDHFLSAQEDVEAMLRRHSEGMDRSSRPFLPYDMQKARAHSPPSSLILTGDGKSTISATSSLSSTPEPSVSNSKQNLGMVAPLLPPEFEPQHSRSLQSSFGCFMPAIAQNQSNLDGNVPAEQPFGLRVNPASQSVLSNQPTSYVHNINHGIAQVGQLGSVPPPVLSQPRFEQPQPHLPRTGGPSPNMHGTSLPLHPQHAFSAAFSPLVTPETHGSLGHSSMPPHQEQAQGMWGSEPPVRTGGQGFGHAAAVDFLQYSHEGKNTARPCSSQQSNPSDGIGYPTSPGVLGSLGLGLRTSAPPLLSNVSGFKDESNIVDSLFGSSSDLRNDAALVSGLRGLAIDLPLGNGSGDPSLVDLWAGGTGTGFTLPPVGTTTVATARSSPQDPLLGLPLHNPTSGPSFLFSNTTTTTAPDDRQRSRFSWSEAG